MSLFNRFEKAGEPLYASVSRFLGFLMVFAIFQGYGQRTPLEILEKSTIYYPRENLEVYATRDTLTAAEALLRISNGRMQELGNTMNPGTSSNAYWVELSILNQTNDGKLLLEIDNPQLDRVGIYNRENDSLQLMYKTGDLEVFSSRPIEHRNFIFPLTIKPTHTLHLLINVDKRASATRFPISVYHESNFPAKVTSETIYYGFYFGFLALLILLTLIIGTGLKKQVFLWYGAYVTSFSLWLFSRAGFTYQYLFPESPLVNFHFFPACTSASVLFLIPYIQSFFETKKLLPTFHKLMTFVAAFIGVGLTAWIVFARDQLQLGALLVGIRYVLLLLVIIFAYTASIKSLKTKPFQAKLFLFGYTLFYVGIFSKVFGEYGWVDESKWILDPIMVGFSIEIVALSIAMASVILGIVKDREKLLMTNVELEKSIERLTAKETEENSFIKLKSKAVIDLNQIRYIQSDDHYVEFHLLNQKHPEIDRNKLSAVRDSLPPQFIQIHRSTIANLEQVKTVYGEYLLLKTGEELKLSRSFKKDLLERLN